MAKAISTEDARPIEDAKLIAYNPGSNRSDIDTTDPTSLSVQSSTIISSPPSEIPSAEHSTEHSITEQSMDEELSHIPHPQDFAQARPAQTQLLY